MKQKILTVVLCCFGLIFMIPSISLGLGLENPADGAGDPTHFELVFPELSLQVDNNLFNIDFLNADMTTDANKDYYLGRMEGQTFKTNLQLDMGTELTIGDLTLHTGLWGGASLNIADGFTRLFFYGYEANQTYNLSGTLASSLVALSCDLTYAVNIPLHKNDLQVGATFRLLEGIAVNSFEIVDSEITTNEWGQAQYKFKVQSYGSDMNNIDFDSFQGQGYLVDLGANYVVDKWKFGIAIKNLGPPMEWDGILIQSAEYEGEVTEIGNAEDPELINTEDQIVNDYEVKIPMVLEAGARYKPLKNLEFNFGLSTALSDGFGYSKTLRFSGDVDMVLFYILHLAGEIYYQGAQMGVNTLTELRLGPLWLNLELGWAGGFAPGNNTSGVNMSLSTRIHF